MKYNKFKYILLILLLVYGCRKFLDVGNPIDKVSGDYVYTSDNSAAAVLTGIYFDFVKDGASGSGITGFSIQLGLAADEFNLSPMENYFFSVSYQNSLYSNFWSPSYNFIFRINAAIEGISASSSLSDGVKSQLLGEAYFLRAFFNFYLVNLYGDIPLLVSSDYKITSIASRTSTKLVYGQIIADLKIAKSLLSEYYVGVNAITNTNERLRPNKYVASTMLARVYLYTTDWDLSLKETDTVINNKSLYDTVALNQVFLKNSKEAIWQLQPVDINEIYKNTPEARLLVLLNGPDPDRPIWASKELLESFDVSDQRLINWFNVSVDNNTGDSYPFFYKYKKYEIEDESEEYIMVLRLAELYLIRAEVFAQLNNLERARSNLNVIRHRAGLDDIGILTKENLLVEIQKERQRELCSESGHRWLDLKRTGRIDDVMNIITPLKGGTWQGYKKWWRIPADDIMINPNLTQNEGW